MSAIVQVLQDAGSDAVVGGNVPARCRIVVTEPDGVTRLGLIGALRSRYYDDAATAALTFEAEDLTPLDSAAVATVSGASGGASNNVVQHSSLRTDWTAVLSTEIDGVGQMTHRGTYVVWVRVYSTSSTPPELRLVWNVGTLVNPQENARVAIPGASNFYWVSLGQVRIDKAPAGSHQWQGQIEAKGDAGGENVSIDEVHVVPADEWYTVLRAPQIVRTPTSYNGSDDFTGTTSGSALNGRTATAGGTWATSGATTDFAFEDSPQEALERNTTSDSGSGRFAVLGSTNFTNMQVEAKVAVNGTPAASTGVNLGVIARWVDSSNYVRCSIRRNLETLNRKTETLLVEQVVSGTASTIASVKVNSGFASYALADETFYTLRLVAYASGVVVAQVLLDGVVVKECSGASSALATGGTLASGKPGLWDRSTSSSTVARDYDDFRVAIASQLDATLYPNQSAELRTDGILREDANGASSAPASHVGNLPRLPVSGLEERPVELYLNASRGDFDQIPDTGIDDISAQVHFNRCWLYLPDGSS